MADVKISALPVAGSASGADLIPIVQGGITKQVAASALTATVKSSGLFAEYRFDEGSGTLLSNSARPVARPTNLLIDPEELVGTGAWTGPNQTLTAHYTAAGPDPIGGDSVTRFVTTATTAYLTQTVTLTSGVSYIHSGYFRSNTGVSQKIRIFGNNGWSSDLTVPATGWVRLSYSWTQSGGTLQGFGNDAASEALDLSVYGMQLEQGTVATTYVPVQGDLTTAGTPVWGGGALDFSGGTKTAASFIPYRSFSQVTLYVVCKWPIANALVTSNYSGLIGGLYSTTESFMLAARNNNTNYPSMQWKSSIVTCPSINLQDGNWHLITGVYDGTTLKMYADDIELGENALAATSTYIRAITISALASSGNSNPFPGSIAYASIYNRGHTTAEVVAQFNAIKSLVAVNGITLTSVPNAIVFEGDSISNSNFGTGTVNSYPLLVTQSISNTSPTSIMAVSGSTMATLATRAPNVDAIFSTVSRTQKVLTVLDGRNDNITTPSIFVALLKSYCLARKAATPGLKIVVGTLLPSTLGGYNTNRNSVNTLIRADTSFYDTLMDFAADSTMGPDAAASNATYYPDGTHPSQAGHNILAPIAQAAIQSVL